MSTHNTRDVQISVIRSKWELLQPDMDERRRRLWAATEANALGRGGIETVHRATGLARGTIGSGIREIQTGERLESTRKVRHEGGGRKNLRDIDETLLADLDALIEPTARGDPMSPLRWTCKSVRRLADELRKKGHTVTHETVCQLLHLMGYGLQANSKTSEAGSHPDRDAQFRYINDQAASFIAAGQPVISVDAKKKELIGDFKNAGQEWNPHGTPERVRVHDFIDPDQGKAIPYGVYDIAGNTGWVSVGVDHDTADFAISTILTWWHQMGKETYPEATTLMITADSGGSNSSRSRTWKMGLRRLANATGLTIQMCHYPPGTSKWNKIEHRLFSFITQNWRAKPLVTHETVINLIANTKTQTGLIVNAALDQTRYPLGQTATDRQLKSLKITPAEFHGEWNYQVAPTIQWHTDQLII